MSKVICDICGTAFPETASQCPICGSAKASDAQTAADSQLGGEAEAHAYAKGGHFSKSNVRKRTKSGKTPERRPAQNRNTRNRNEEKEPANWSMVVVVLLHISVPTISVSLQNVQRQAIRKLRPSSRDTASHLQNISQDLLLSYVERLMQSSLQEVSLTAKR